MLRACWLPDEDGGTLLLHLHHIAVDGWSLSVLLRDLSAGYVNASETGQEQAAPTPLDFADWQAGWFAAPAYRAQRDQLLAYYRGLEEPRKRSPSRSTVRHRGHGCSTRPWTSCAEPRWTGSAPSSD
ncbi:condensation domain-containing protein [Streptomyces sp. M10(2022)]